LERIEAGPIAYRHRSVKIACTRSSDLSVYLTAKPENGENLIEETLSIIAVMFPVVYPEEFHFTRDIVRFNVEAD
jgi:hypothetical protein